MNFDGSSKLFQELFEPILKPDGTAVYRTYIYLISKVVDGERYYKLGEGTRSMKRMTDAATYLVPGNENRWFQVHMLVFYEYSPFKLEYSTLIEKECHKVLRREFPEYVLRFPSSNPSEWYRPGSQKRFFEYVQGMIAAQTPAPESAFTFTKTQRRRLSLKKNRKFAKFQKNHEAVLRKIRVERKTEGVERLRTRGSKEHFQNRLIGATFKDGKLWKITDVDWDRGLKRYIVSYEPSKISRSTSQQDRLGYETQLSEVLEMMGEKQRKELGVEENFAYWDGLRKNDLTGKGISGLCQWRAAHGNHCDDVYKEAMVVTLPPSMSPPPVVLFERRPKFRSDAPVLVASSFPLPPELPQSLPAAYDQPRRSDRWLNENERQIARFYTKKYET